ncbi:MAG TPA: hypothetical protein VGH32_09300, partial [Pirellulales bacterium]
PSTSLRTRLAVGIFFERSTMMLHRRRAAKMRQWELPINPLLGWPPDGRLKPRLKSESVFACVD